MGILHLNFLCRKLLASVFLRFLKSFLPLRIYSWSESLRKRGLLRSATISATRQLLPHTSATLSRFHHTSPGWTTAPRLHSLLSLLFLSKRLSLEVSSCLSAAELS